MAVSDEAASAAEPSAADAWFQRKMALHEAARRASANARQAGAVAEQKRLERTEEAVRRVDRELEWNRARVSALRARLETVIAPRRAARDARDPTAKHKSAPKPVFVSYARDAPFAERALVRAVVDAINETLSSETSTRSSTCWHDDDDVPFSESRDWKHVQLCRVDAANGCDVFVVVGSPSYEKSAACALGAPRSAFGASPRSGAETGTTASSWSPSTPPRRAVSPATETKTKTRTSGAASGRRHATCTSPRI